MTSKLKYYTASLAFLSGVILALAGVVFAISVNLTRASDPAQINFTYSLVAFGLAVSIGGLNLMVKQRSVYTNYVIPLGLVLSVAGVGKFALEYPQGWFYPNITYIILLYAGGITILVANSFANAVLNLIEGKPVSIKQEVQYSEEDIEREVDRAIEESSRRLVEFSDSGLGFKDVDMRGFRPSSAFEEDRETTRVKDRVEEVKILQDVGSGRVEIVDKDLEKVSSLLRDTTSSDDKEKEEKSRYNRFIQKLSN
ncbi:MAG: hypothetical protein R6U44_07435 [Archaeoglobaceae archaeon]